VAEHLNVRFWMDAYRNEAKTKEAGRVIFDTVPWCEIKVPGEHDNTLGPVHRMNPDPRQRFPEAWAAFQRDNTAEGFTGTPLKEVAWMERGDVESLAYAGVKSLEQLASVTDANLSGLSGGLSLRTKAKAALEQAASAAPALALKEELAQRDTQIAAMREQIAEMQATIKAANLKKKPGPKPKVAPAEVTE